MVLTDGSKLKSTRCEDIEEIWDPRELRPAVTQFAVEIWEVFYLAKRAWLEVLEKIDQLVGAELGDLNDAQHLNDLIFDASFERSKTYFTALQILRLVDEWSSESVTSLDELTERVMDLRGSDPGLKVPLPKIRSEVEAEVQKISRRVKAKMAEIESLRDGLFNATSLRGATRAMDLNKSIYIFTIVTVLFTPTMWALPFLNNPKDEGGIVPEPQGFRASFVAVPLLTYGLVGLCAWVMFPQGKWYSFPTQQLLRAWASLYKSLSRFVSEIWWYVVLFNTKLDDAVRSLIVRNERSGTEDLEMTS
ncbi:hypothetical protein N3K66_000203 [Trichothecium roseum]|uniref:Uncharacterized protein n=1 Tax=Trichothecium roseum TaxID=47278 RepID=A0ACC0VBV1_9HYPO|nr:hypothetical protein N3K66_000203 [Trichothecium roseum]